MLHNLPAVMTHFEPHWDSKPESLMTQSLHCFEKHMRHTSQPVRNLWDMSTHPQSCWQLSHCNSHWCDAVSCCVESGQWQQSRKTCEDKRDKNSLQEKINLFGSHMLWIDTFINNKLLILQFIFTVSVYALSKVIKKNVARHSNKLVMAKITRECFGLFFLNDSNSKHCLEASSLVTQCHMKNFYHDPLTFFELVFFFVTVAVLHLHYLL